MSSSLQDIFMDRILDHFPKKAVAVDYLSQFLSLSPDGVYRRLRGETLLTPDEVFALAKEFNISIDNIINTDEQNLIFSFNAFNQPVTDFSIYIDQLLFTADQILPLPEVELYYAAQELSILFLPSFPRVFAFRMYVYGLTYWKIEHLQDTQFDFSLVPASVFEKGQEIVKKYNSINSHELWDLSLIDNTLNQIEYLATIDRFKNIEQVRILCQDFIEIMEHLKKMAKHGRKFLRGEEPTEESAVFDLYYNEFASTNDSLLFSSPLKKLLFTSFGSPDFLSTDNQRFCKHLEEWFKTIIARSTSISTHSERKRDWFFRQLEKKIHTTRKKIEILYDY